MLREEARVEALPQLLLDCVMQHLGLIREVLYGFLLHTVVSLV